MNRCRLSALSLGGAAALAILLTSEGAQALIINLTFVDENQAFPGLTQGGNPVMAFPPSISAQTYPGPPAGGARGDAQDKMNLNSILMKDMTCAALWWQAAIPQNFTLNIAYGWYDDMGVVPNAIGLFDSTKRDGNGRSTSGVVRFDWNATTPWFLDNTPPKSLTMGNEEFGALQTTSSKLGTATDINTGRYFLATANGPADGRLDLFSVALHELGHALGIDDNTPGFKNSLDAGKANLVVDQDRPAGSGTKGAMIPIFSGGMNLDNGGHLNLPNAVMYPQLNVGTRVMLSAADILAAAQSDDFTQVVLNPAGHAPAAPEPPAAALLAVGCAACILARRRGPRLTKRITRR